LKAVQKAVSGAAVASYTDRKAAVPDALAHPEKRRRKEKKRKQEEIEKRRKKEGEKKYRKAASTLFSSPRKRFPSQGIVIDTAFDHRHHRETLNARGFRKE